MVEAHVLRAHGLASFEQYSFLSRHGQVFRAITDLDGEPSEIARSIHELHQRYGKQFMEVVNRELARHSSLDATLRLPATSLLAMIRTGSIELPATVDPARNEPPASVAAANDPKPVRRLRLVFAVREKPPQIAFVDGPILKGVAYEVFAILIRQFRQDLEDGLEGENRSYVPTDHIIRELEINSDTLRTRIMRIRRKLEREFEARTGYMLDSEDVIQSINWTGYRLNPYLIETDVRQVPHKNVVSRSSVRNVTSSDARA